MLAILGLLIPASCTLVDKTVSRELRTDAYEKGIMYDLALRKALMGDSVEIIRLSTLELTGGLIAENGSQLISIVDRIGEQRFCRIVHNLSPGEKKTIGTNISAGVDFTLTRKYQYKDLKVIFPVVSDELGNGNNSTR